MTKLEILLILALIFVMSAGHHDPDIETLLQFIAVVIIGVILFIIKKIEGKKCHKQ